MTGHVFHPGHDELHGVTVVLTGKSGKVYLGRWHEQGTRGVTMRDVATYDPAVSTTPLTEWLAKQRKFGVAATDRHLIVPAAEVDQVEQFGE